MPRNNRGQSGFNVGSTMLNIKDRPGSFGNTIHQQVSSYHQANINSKSDQSEEYRNLADDMWNKLMISGSANQRQEAPHVPPVQPSPPLVYLVPVQNHQPQPQLPQQCFPGNHCPGFPQGESPQLIQSVYYPIAATSAVTTSQNQPAVDTRVDSFQMYYPENNIACSVPQNQQNLVFYPVQPTYYPGNFIPQYDYHTQPLMPPIDPNGNYCHMYPPDQHYQYAYSVAESTLTENAPQYYSQVPSIPTTVTYTANVQPQIFFPPTLEINDTSNTQTEGAILPGEDVSSGSASKDGALNSVQKEVYANGPAKHLSKPREIHNYSNRNLSNGGTWYPQASSHCKPCNGRNQNAQPVVLNGKTPIAQGVPTQPVHGVQSNSPDTLPRRNKAYFSRFLGPPPTRPQVLEKLENSQGNQKVERWMKNWNTNKFQYQDLHPPHIMAIRRSRSIESFDHNRINGRRQGQGGFGPGGQMYPSRQYGPAGSSPGAYNNYKGNSVNRNLDARGSNLYTRRIFKNPNIKEAPKCSTMGAEIQNHSCDDSVKQASEKHSTVATKIGETVVSPANPNDSNNKNREVQRD